MTIPELATIRDRAYRATPRPWSTFDSGADWPIEAGPNADCLGHSPDDGVRAGFKREDAEFIANARQDIPRLVNALYSVLETATAMAESAGDAEGEVQATLRALSRTLHADISAALEVDG